MHRLALIRHRTDVLGASFDRNGSAHAQTWSMHEGTPASHRPKNQVPSLNRCQDIARNNICGNRDFFYESGKEADVCGLNLVEPKRKRQAELRPAKRLRRAGLSHEDYRTLSSDDEDIQGYSPPSPCYDPCESADYDED
ncbi:hypothetical protein AVEN_13884-1 [Araneus ventricosus]|uniref:Uncharacterized protein n=1 Tax=Araneus ventricosus TaxID=182803 RepID=A0A4Y2M5Z6_ARAVE|nr:hypothetical protein AVEN_13884-1 [Araneus ventricosus]